MTKKLKITILTILLMVLCFQCRNQDDHTIENIRTYAKLYGYVRFFHPSDESTQIDWNRFAVYGVKRVSEARNTEELKGILEELFLPIAPSLVIYQQKNPHTFTLSSVQPPEATGTNVIAWQHRGVKLKNSPKEFNSIRINRKNKIYSGYGFGNLFQHYQAKPYQGKEFLYRATVYIRKGKARLWFREDRLSSKPGYFDNMYDRPIQPETIPSSTSKNQQIHWETYVISGKLSQDAKNIAIGCFLEGSGEVFIDNVELLIKEKDQWKPVPIINPGFEADKTGKAPMFWWTRGEGYSFTITDQTSHTGHKCVLIESNTINGPDRLYPQYPSIGEHINTNIGNGLACILPLALYGTSTYTYPISQDHKLNDLLSAIQKNVPATSGPEARYTGQAAIVITWTVLNHFYPYFDRINVNWEKELTQALRRLRNETNEIETLKTIQAILAPLSDCNAEVYHPVLKDLARLPFKAEWIENRAVITATRDKLYQKGDIILALNGEKIEKILRNSEQYISGTPQWKRAKAISLLGNGLKNTTIHLLLQRKNKIVEIDAIRDFNGQIKDTYRKSIQKLDNNIYYVDIERITLKEFNSNQPLLAKANGIIFDARGYVAYEKRKILGALVEHPVKTPAFQFPEIIYPDRQKINFTDISTEITPTTPRINAPCIFLIDAGTINATETFLEIVEHNHLGEILGQPSAGTNGNINILSLPGGYRVFWTGMQVQKYDTTERHNRGIIPAIPVNRTIQGIRQEKDEFIEVAIKILSNERK